MILRHEVAWLPSSIFHILRDSRVHVVHAPRGSGKTTELLRYVRDRHQHEAIIVAFDSNNASAMAGYWRQSSPLRHEGELVPPTPRIYSGKYDNLVDLLRGTDLPIFVDEWNELSPFNQEEILATGRFRKAVSS